MTELGKGHFNLEGLTRPARPAATVALHALAHALEADAVAQALLLDARAKKQQTGEAVRAAKAEASKYVIDCPDVA